MTRLIWIPCDPDDFVLAKDVEPTLDRMQSLVGGYVEAIVLTNPPALLCVNEDGKALGLRYNSRATQIFWQGRRDGLPEDYIAGDAFLIGPVARNGKETDVPDEYREMAL